MDSAKLGTHGQKLLAKLLGYLNFSSGTTDPQFLSNVNQLYGIWLEKQGGRSKREASLESIFWRDLHVCLEDRLQQLKSETDTFSDDLQVRSVLRLVRDQIIPGYLEFHRDLLHHQSEAWLFGPFMWGCACQAVLAQGAPWDDESRICSGTLDALNDYVGYRPVPALESRKLEPYPHERVRPVPIYVDGAGPMFGRYHDVVERTLKILRETDPTLLRSAQLDPDRIAELAIDPRAYDFEHPVNKRPNYQFGMWDPHCIDNQGYFRRFIVQQLTLEALMSRLGNVRNRSADQLLTEAAAVLAGTILMASGISGEGPQSHDSSVSLGDLIQRIAAYRDIFYEQLLERLEGKHADLLRKEAEKLQQPFGGARQHLNTQLARRRAEQLERIRLANVFAHMGYLESAERLVEGVQVPAARMASRMNCLLIEGGQAVRNGVPEKGLANLRKVRELLDRAIGCGAAIDPWNILGFDANFALFPALENSVYDHRADDLIEMMERMFGLYGATWSDAAAANKEVLAEEISAHYLDLCRWWNQFAIHEVSSVQIAPPLEAYQAAEIVAQAMKFWHRGGAEAGDIKFWAPHVAMFDSPKAYAYVVEALLERHDYVSSMSLLVHWLGKAPVIALEDPHGSFHHLAQLWMHQLAVAMLEVPQPVDSRLLAERPPMDRRKAWELMKKFLDYLEANADEYWSVPAFETGTGDRPADDDEERTKLAADNEGEDEDEEEEEQSLFRAAYENVVYQDSTNDGVESSIYDPLDSSESDLEQESERVIDRLAFLDTLARLWRTASIAYARTNLEEQSEGHESPLEASESLRQWHRQTAKNQNGLATLRAAVRRYRLTATSVTQEAMIHYDRCRLIKESLLEQIIGTTLEIIDSGRFVLAAALATSDPQQVLADESWAPGSDEEDVEIGRLLAAALREDREQAAERVLELIEGWSTKRILYVPLAKAGDPGDILQSRVRQRALENLLAWLPRLGLLTETQQLIELTREMERNVAVAGGAVTQFDELFETGYRAIVQCVERTYSAQDPPPEESDTTPDAQLVNCLERVTEALLLSWLEHSRTLRLSVLEKVRKKDSWKALQDFIQRYGQGLFTQSFLNLSNIRAILHRGVGVWLDQVAEQADGDQQPRLLRELGERLDQDEAIEHMTLVLEGVVENFGEYREYNGTTTQSDRGEMLYTLFDFLRLKSSYDRIVWNLRPIVLAHDVLVRKGRNEAAQIWRRALTERIGDEADRYIRKLKTLQRKYAMRMPSIADRIGERFLRPMVIDRMRALVEPAVAQRAAGDTEPHSFEILEEECMLLMREPAGSGLDVPAWLSALEMEVIQLDSLQLSGRTVDVNELLQPRQQVTVEQIEEQLDNWASGA